MSYKVLAAACAFGSLMVPPAASSENTISENVAAERIDACTLLRPGEISQIIALPVGAGVRRDTGFESDGSYSSTCIWAIEPQKEVPADPEAPLGGQKFVILNVMRWPQGSKHTGTFLEAFREAAASGEIPGALSPREFGDEALWWGDGLAVRKGEISFGVSVFLPGKTQERPGVLEEQLASRILRQLDNE